MRRHPPGNDLGHRVQVGPTVVRDDALRVACRARGVVQGDWTKLVLRQGPVVLGVAVPQERFVIHFSQQGAARVQCVVDVDHHYRAFQHCQRALDDAAEFAVGNQHFCFPVGELEGDGFGVKPDVQRVQHRTGHRHAEMRLVHRRNIGRHHGDRIAGADAALRQGRGQAPASSVGFRPGTAPGAMHEGDPIRMDGRRLRQEAQRRQRGVICEVPIKTTAERTCFPGVGFQ